MSERAVDLCKRYAIEAMVAGNAQSILQMCHCEFKSKPYSPVYTSDFVCVDPGDPGRRACTLMTQDELAIEDQEGGGICENCEKHRIPALKQLQEAKKRMAKTRKDIVREGTRMVKLEDLEVALWVSQHTSSNLPT